MGFIYCFWQNSYKNSWYPVLVLLLIVFKFSSFWIKVDHQGMPDKMFVIFWSVFRLFLIEEEGFGFKPLEFRN